MGKTPTESVVDPVPSAHGEDAEIIVLASPKPHLMRVEEGWCSQRKTGCHVQEKG